MFMLCDVIRYPYFSTDSNAPTTRGNKFALAFMRGLSEITLYITTEQNVSNFTIETKFSGLLGFNETSPDSGSYSRTGIARRGEYTIIQLQADGDSNGLPDLSVQSDGNKNTSDRQKGLILTADNRSDELTIYAFSNLYAGAFMAINCVEFPTARDYQYFVFSSEGGESQFLMTPCQDNTTIRVRPSQPYTHPSWVNPSVQRTTPGILSQEEAIYGQCFNRFDTLMLSNDGDLTGTIITSDKPLSVFSGFVTAIEQIPPHSTYGDFFFLILPDSNYFRIGSVSDEASLRVNCPCEPVSVSNNRLPLSGSGRFFTAVINRGQYVECRSNRYIFCSVQSTRPVTVMTFVGFSIFSMVYIPPVDSYLTQYSLPKFSDVFLVFSYTLQEQNQKLIINGDVLSSSEGYTTIDCRLDCFESIVCGRGANHLFFNLTVDIQSTGDIPFWGYVHSFDSFAYPQPFGMRPIACKFTP